MTSAKGEIKQTKIVSFDQRKYFLFYDNSAKFDHDYTVEVKTTYAYYINKFYANDQSVDRYENLFVFNRKIWCYNKIPVMARSADGGKFIPTVGPVRCFTIYTNFK